MVEERIMLQVLAEQKEYVGNYHPKQWVKRNEESLFEFESPLAQVVIGVRRSGKSTLCHKVLLEHRVNYGYANFDDDRFARLQTEDLNTLLSFSMRYKMLMDGICLSIVFYVPTYTLW